MSNEQKIIEGVLRVESRNDRRPNPHPICKPRLYDIEHCERCGHWIKGVSGPCRPNKGGEKIMSK